MEKKLKALFDYQRFEQNKTLEKLISESEERVGSELSDEDLFYVNAAGVPESNQEKTSRTESSGPQPRKKQLQDV